MDLRNELFASRKKGRGRKWRASLFSLFAHGGIIALIVFISMHAPQKAAAEQKPLRAYLSSAAPPPPPPPPPPPAASHPANPTPVKPMQVPQRAFVQPLEIPKEI